MKRLLKLILSLLGGLALLVIAGAILLQLFFQGFLEDYVQDHYGWTLKIGSAELQFSPLSVRFESIEIAAPDRKPFFQARSVYAAVPYSSFWGDEFVVDELSVDSPQLDLNQFPERTKSTTAEESPGEPPQFRIQRVQITSAVLNAGEYTVDQIRIHAEVDSSGVELKDVKAEFKGFRLESHGSMQDWNRPELELNYDLSGEVSNIVSLFPDVGDLKGVLSASGTVKGTVPELVIAGRTEKGFFSLNNSNPFSVSAEYQYALTDADNPVQLKIDWDSLPLTVMVDYWKNAPQIRSLSSGTLDYSGNTQDWWAGSGSVVIQASKERGTGAGSGKDSRRTSGIPLEGEIRGVLSARTFRIQESQLRVGSSVAGLKGTLTGENLNVRVTLDTPGLTDLAFVDPSLDRVPGAFRIRAQAEGPYQDIRIQAEILGDSKFSSLKAQGTLRTGSGNLAAQFEGNTAAGEWENILPQLAGGNVAFTGSAGGTLKNPSVDLVFDAKDLQYDNLQLNQVAAGMTLRGDLIQFHAEAPDLLLSTEGSYRLQTEVFQIQGGVSGVTIAQLSEAYTGLPEALAGTIYASFEAQGNAAKWKQSEAQLVIEETEIQWNQARFQIPVGIIRLQNGTAQLDLKAQADNADFELNGSVLLLQDMPVNLQLSSRLSAALIERLTEEWKGTGEVVADVRIAGSVKDPDLNGRIVTDNMEISYLPRELAIQIVHAEAEFSKANIDLMGNGNLDDASFQWEGSIPLNESGGTLNISLNDLPVSLLTSNPNLSGSFDVVAELQGQGFPLEEWSPNQTSRLPFHDWNGDLTITPKNLKLGQSALLVEKPLELSLENRTVSLSPSRITAGDLLDLSAQGSLNLDTGALESSVRTEAKIDLLSSLKADMQSSGPLVLDLKLSGTLEKPQYIGVIQLSDAFLRIPETPVSLENLDLRATLDESGLHVTELQARSGGGSITGGGDLDLVRKSGQVWVKGNNVAMNYPEGLRSQLDFDLKLAAQETDLLLSGDVQVLRSFYEQQLSLRSPIVKKLLASKQEVGTEKLLKNRIKLGLNVRTIQDFLLKNSLANLRGTGNLQVEGSLLRPRLVGRLSLREGSRIFLLGNQFYVEKANIDFFGSELLEPSLDVTLTTLLRDSKSDIFYEVYIPFSGSTSDIEFNNVRSTPSLSENQIFSLLSQGTVEAEEGGYAAAFQRQLLAFLAGQVLGSPGAVVAKTVGLSRIQIQQEGLSSVSDPKTRLVLGKDIGANFTLIYSFVLNDPQDQTWVASYRYGRNIVARFIDQDDGTYTTSVSHRIQFGAGAPPDSGIQTKRSDRGPTITSIQLQNHSSLTDQQVRSLLKASEGDNYDYWRFQEGVDNLKRQLQKQGYLSPSVDVNETESGKDIALSVEIQPGSPGQMIFRGYKINAKQIDQYNKEWRVGISPAIVQLMIQEDLLRQLRSSGYHQAIVQTTKEEAGNESSTRVTYYFDIDPGPRYASVELQFLGAKQFEPQVLQRDLNALYGSTAEMFVEAIHDFPEFSSRIKALYVQRGYVLTEVSSDTPVYQPERSRILCRIRIQEGPQSLIAAVTPEGVFPEELQSQLQLRPGSPLDLDALLEDELTVTGWYESKGYPEVAVSYDLELKNSGPDILVQWTLKTGQLATIASVRVEGNQSTRSDLILRMANLKAGEALTPYRTSLARKRISDLGVFQQVGIDTEETGEPGSYDVVISVAETRRYELQYGGRYNTSDKVGAEVRLSDFNFLGKAHNLSLYARSSFDQPLFRFDYTLPVTGNIWDRTRFSFFRDRRDDDVEAIISGDKVTFPFELTQLVVQLQQDRRLGKAYNLIWGVEYGSNDVLFVDSETEGEDRAQGTVARLRSAFVVEKRDDPLNARKGYFYSADAEFAPTVFGSDISYFKFYSQYFLYRKFGSFVSASGLRAGFLNIRSNILTVSEKFRTGGSTTLRGFELNQVVPGDDPISIFFGGDSVFILNQEIRFPIYKWFSGAAFYDGGNVYFNASDFDPFKLRHSAGFGIRGGTGSFLLRLDLGFNLNPRENESHTVFHFGIGQAF